MQPPADPAASARDLRLTHVVSAIVLALGSVVVCVSVWLSFERNLDLPWTSIRLAPSFALVRGYPLYSMPDTPPWVMVAYGPLFPVFYLPSTFASDPSPAVAVATLLAHVYILAPAALLFAAHGRRLRAEQAPVGFHWSLALLFFALLAFTVPSLNYVTTYVHVDAPALGLVVVAAYAVLRASWKEARLERWLLVAGICAGLAAACKVNLLAAAFGMFLWSIWSLGARRALLLLLGAGASFGGVYACAAIRDGLAPVLLNLSVPGRMPWFTFENLDTLALSGHSDSLLDKVRTVLTFTGSYLRDYGIVALAVLLLLPTLEQRSASAAKMIRFFLFLAVVMALASVPSVGKSGGDVNSRALVSLPLTLAAVLAFATLAQPSTRRGWMIAYAPLVAAVFIVSLGAGAGIRKFTTGKLPTLLEAYTVISSEPGRWYFPFDPLAHLLVEGKFRPNIDVIHSYAAAGVPVEERAFRSALPEELQYIALPPSIASWGLAEIQRLVPEYSRGMRAAHLQHHDLLAR